MLDPTLLVSFLAIVDEGSFAAAAKHLGVGASTVSQHVRRLEAEVGRRLLDRDTHSVSPTVDGHAFVDLARRVVDAERRARAYFSDAGLRGRVRLGVSEDFALSHLLPKVLRRFAGRHPSVDLEMTVGLSADLHAQLYAGGLDLLFAKRRPGDTRGVTVWRDPLVWIGAPDWHVPVGAPLPLVLYPPPSITRARILDALGESRRAWRIACTCGSLGGLRSAVFAGLGISAQSRKLIPRGLVAIEGRTDLPELTEVDFVLLPARHRPEAAVLELMRAFSEFGNE